MSKRSLPQLSRCATGSQPDSAAPSLQVGVRRFPAAHASKNSQRSYARSPIANGLAMTPATSETAAGSERSVSRASGRPLRTFRWQRLLPPAVLIGLLVATAAAFAITERLKLEQSPVYGTQI